MCAGHQVSPPYSTTDRQLSCPTHPSSILIDSYPEGSSMAEGHACRRTGGKLTNPCRCQVTLIDVLPDEALLEIFGFCLDENASEKEHKKAWRSLVHVCRRWRSVVFGSPRRLNLRLVCGPGTPESDKLDIWPPLPLVIRGRIPVMDPDGEGDDLITILKRHRDRVCQIDLHGVALPLGNVMAAMKEPFPELTDLLLSSFLIAGTRLPNSFLGGCAPRLRKLHLHGIPFPGLPKLLLSAPHLVKIQLNHIPDSGYFSPDALVTALSTLTSLRLLILKFKSSPNLASRHPPPTRSLLPVLNTLSFEGASEYLDDFVACIDAPRLNDLKILFFDQSVLDTQQFTSFIRRAPMLQAFKKVYVAFQFMGAAVKLSSPASGYGELEVRIPCEESNRQLSSLKRFCTSYLPLSTSEDVYIHLSVNLPSDREENTLWLDLFHLFTNVKNLYLSEEVARHIGHALEELVGGSTTEVLPIVQNVFLEELRPVPEGIEKFSAARQLSGQPITVSIIPHGEEDSMRRWVRGFHGW